MWEKIVLNLLSNAYKFTFAGEIDLTLKPVDGAVELQVRDTGVGIPEEHREQVFERFHRIESAHARTYEGTGIGLALVQELVRLHGGSVRVESAVGAGSTFRVTIPRGKEHLPAERIQAPQSLASTTIRAEGYVEERSSGLGNEPGMAVDAATSPKLASPAPSPIAIREAIVVADDNADMRQYLTRLLSDRYEVRTVANGRQAFEAIQQLRPALVLADVMMPHLDGFGLLRAIREDSALAGTPVILLSARAGEESRVRRTGGRRRRLSRQAILLRRSCWRVWRSTSQWPIFAAKLRSAKNGCAARRNSNARNCAPAKNGWRRQGVFMVSCSAAMPSCLAQGRETAATRAAIRLDAESRGTPDFVNQVWLNLRSNL